MTKLSAGQSVDQLFSVIEIGGAQPALVNMSLIVGKTPSHASG
tara:strand:- start:19 stop:147 length:129 start_codon:yes stop_codon:yes gene_type:complete